MYIDLHGFALANKERDAIMEAVHLLNATSHEFSMKNWKLKTLETKNKKLRRKKKKKERRERRRKKEAKARSARGARRSVKSLFSFEKKFWELGEEQGRAASSWRLRILRLRTGMTTVV